MPNKNNGHLFQQMLYAAMVIMSAASCCTMNLILCPHDEQYPLCIPEYASCDRGSEKHARHSLHATQKFRGPSCEIQLGETGLFTLSSRSG